MKPDFPSSSTAAFDASLAEFGIDDNGCDWLDRVREADVPVVLRRVGAFELLEEVGRGGQGVVYRARNAKTGRELAVKQLLTGSFVSSGARQRVRREMSAAEALDHPIIVKVTGVHHVEGHILLTMDWVSGLPITTWADGLDTGRRSTRDILRTFTGVCDAVHHAHLRGVIHRDIKPSNILVEGDGTPRVLDFGLAKLAAAFGPVGADVTHTGQFIGTPCYASPEQVRGRSSAIDVRSDVYAIGVTLYEALTGRMPYNVDGPLVEVFRAVERDDPARLVPSDGRYDRELEAIVFKTLEKDPERRYQSVAALGVDLQRCLDGDPVDARAHSRVQMIGKRIRRHKAALAIGSVFIVILIAYAASTTFMYARAEREGRKAERVQRFLEDTFSSASPYRSGGDVTVSRLLEQASQRIDRELAGQPEIEAGVRNTIAQTYANLWMWERVEPQARRAYELRKRILGEEHPDTSVSLNLLVRALSFMEDPESVRLARLAIKVRSRVHGENHELTAESLHGYAFALLKTGDRSHRHIEALYRRALSIYEQRAPGAYHPWGRALFGYATLCSQARREHEADAAFRKAIEIFRALSHEGGSFYLMQCIKAHGDSQYRFGRLAEAEASYREALSLQPGDPPSRDLIGLNWRLAAVSARASRSDDAIHYYNTALAMLCERLLPLKPPDVDQLRVLAARLRAARDAEFPYDQLFDLIERSAPQTAEAWRTPTLAYDMVRAIAEMPCNPRSPSVHRWHSHPECMR